MEIGEIIDWFFGLSNLQQGVLSLILTVIIAFIVKRLVWLPLDRFADQTESEVDDEVIDSIGSMTFTAVIIVGMVVSLNFALKGNDVINIGNNICSKFKMQFSISDYCMS